MLNFPIILKKNQINLKVFYHEDFKIHEQQHI